MVISWLGMCLRCFIAKMLEQGSTDSFQEILTRLFFRLLSSFSLILIKIEYLEVY